MTLFLVSVLGALSISAVCSFFEAVLLSYTPSQVASLQAKRPRIGALWKRFKENIERPIAVILVVNTMAHTMGATFAGAQFETIFGARYLLVFSILFTYFMLQFTEILPKSLGVRYNGLAAPVIAPILDILIRVMAPVLWFIHLVNRPFERKQAQEDNPLEVIAAMAASARLSDVIHPMQADIIESASELAELRVRQIMTARMDVLFLEANMPIEKILDILKLGTHTRLPLCQGDIDHVIGMVHVKDILRHMNLMPGRFQVVPIQREAASPQELVQAVPGTDLHVFGGGTIDLHALKREVLFLPEHLPVLKALRSFQEAHIHLAIVVDEFGSTQGIITMEDVIEEIVGEIEDEFDIQTPALIAMEGDAYRVNARMPLYVLEDEIPDIGIDHTEEDVDTVGGYVSKVLSRVPSRGESIEVGKYQWTVAAADARRVREVLIAPHKKNSQTLTETDTK